MTCKFITGSRRSGKTEKLYEDIFAALAQGNKKVYLILPEQSTFYHEKNLEKYRRGRSVWDLEITSFRRLAEKFVPTPLLSPLGQQLTLFQALNSHKDEFQSFQVKDISPGLVDAALSAVKEALLNYLTAESLREKAASIKQDGVAGDLPKKLLDLALLLSDIESQGNSQGVFDGNLLLKYFLTNLEKGNILQDSLLFFDDFSDFTTVEYSIIQSFLRLGIDLSFAFTYCPGDIKFRKVAQAIEGITKMAQAERRQVTRIALKADRENTPLTYLAKHCLGGAKPFSGKNNNEVALFHGSEPAGEIEGIAREICRLKEQGYSNSDICVNFRDIVPYLPHIKEQFALYGVDYYLDDPVSLQNDPIFFYASALLRVAAERWSYSSVFALLKSGLFPVAAGDCDEFENYCLAHGIKGKRFYGEEPLVYCHEKDGEDIEAANRIRSEIRDFLLPFTDALKKAVTARNYAIIIWDFLEQSDVNATMENWGANEERAGRFLKGTELAASLTRLGELLDQIVLAFAENKFTLGEFSEVFQLGCKLQKLRTIPQSTDSVEINILGQSRPASAKIVFLAGVNEGSFPNYTSLEGFFNSHDREILGRDTSFWLRNKAFYYDNENLLIYQGVSQATEKLYLSYTEGTSEDPAGGSFLPSVLIDTVKSIFPAIPDKLIIPGAGGGGESDVFWSPQKVLSSLPWLLCDSPDDEGWRQAAAYLQDNPNTALATEFALRSLDYTGSAKPLSPATMEKYLRHNLYMNVSSLDVYRRCPFSYYAKYGLKLRERRELRFDAPNLGTFYHEALRLLVEKMQANAIPWSELDREGPRLISQIIEEMMVEFGEHSLFSPEKKDFVANLIKENLLFAVQLMAQQIEKGDKFFPVRCEASFGPEEEFVAQAYTLADSDKKIIFTGQIDRVDLAPGDGKNYMRIIDYKTGDKKLKMDDIYYGLKLQLLIYLLIVENNGLKNVTGSLEPGGIFYLSTKDLYINVDTDISEEKLTAELEKKSQMSGYIIGDEEVKHFYPPDAPQKRLTKEEHDTLMNYLAVMIKKVGADIFNGVNEIRPYYRDGSLGCKQCSYSTVCGYEEKLQGKPVSLYPIKEEEAAAKIKAAVKGGEGQ